MRLSEAARACSREEEQYSSLEQLIDLDAPFLKRLGIECDEMDEICGTRTSEGRLLAHDLLERALRFEPAKQQLALAYMLFHQLSCRRSRGSIPRLEEYQQPVFPNSMRPVIRLVFEEDLVARFCGEWKQGKEPRLTQYLNEFPENSQKNLLETLLPMDIICQCTSAVTKDLLRGYFKNFRGRADLKAVLCEVFRLPVPGQDRLGENELLDLVGIGGMGVVFRAKQDVSGWEVAVKMMRSECDARHETMFLEEARETGEIHASGVVRVLSVGSARWRGRDVPFYVMDYVSEGQTLHDRIRSPDWKLTANPRRSDIRSWNKRVANYAQRIAEALVCLHTGRTGTNPNDHQSRARLHLDIKPGNVLVGRDGEVWVSDLGVSRKLISRGASLPGMRSDCADLVAEPLPSNMGTPGTAPYMSPEQLQNGELSPSSDIYAVGASLYEMLTGSPPFFWRQGEGDEQFRQRILSEDPGDPHHEAQSGNYLSKPLVAICMKCLQKDARKRYQSAQNLVKDLKDFADGMPITALPFYRQPICLLRQHSVVAYLCLAALGTVLILAAALERVRMREANVQFAEMERVVGGRRIRRIETSDPALSGVPNLRVAIDLIGDRRADEHLEQLTRYAPYIEGLDLGNLELEPAHVTNRGLACIGNFNALKWLALPGAAKVTDDGLAALKTLRHLKALNIAMTKVGDKGAAYISSLTQLETADFRGTNVTNAALINLGKLQSLKVLLLWDCDIGDAGLAHLEHLTQLEHLDLGWTKVTDAGLVHLKKLASLKGLLLEGCDIGDRGLAHLENVAGLRWLDLNRTMVTNLGLASLKRLSGLQRLELGEIKINDAGLANVGCLVELKYLWLGALSDYRPRGRQRRSLPYPKENTETVTDTGIACLKNILNLEVLALHQVPMTAAAVARLNEFGTVKELHCPQIDVRMADRILGALPQLIKMCLDHTSMSREDVTYLSNKYPGKEIADGRPPGPQ